MIVLGSAGKMSCLAETLIATRDLLGPGGGGAARLLDHPFAQLHDQARFLGERDEIVGRDDAAGRMVPADQRLEADQALVGGVDQRLVEQAELLGLDAGAHVLLELEPVLGLVLHVGVEEAAGAAALVLRLVEREIGLLDEVVDALAVDRAEGAADRDADPDLGLVDVEGLGDRGDQPVGERLDHAPALRVLDDDGEFVAAHPADMAERRRLP